MLHTAQRHFVDLLWPQNYFTTPSTTDDMHKTICLVEGRAIEHVQFNGIKAHDECTKHTFGITGPNYTIPITVWMRGN